MPAATAALDKGPPGATSNHSLDRAKTDPDPIPLLEAAKILSQPGALATGSAQGP